MKKVLITGATGFAGSFLVEELVKTANYKLFGTYLTDSSLINLSHLEEGKIDLLKLDLLNTQQVQETIDSLKPDLIFHLAALAATAESFDKPWEVFANNVSSQLNVLEALRKAKLMETKTLIISSAEVYGLVDQKFIPINEETPFRPDNPYAVSKLTQDFFALQYFLSYGLKIVRVRPFNHIGPRQSPSFVVSSFAKKIAQIEKGIIPTVLKVGNLETKRDFTDVRDMVKAYVLSLEKGVSGDVYNLGSGKSHKISDILNKMIKMSKANIKIEIDQSLFRPSDAPDSVCDYTKFNKLTNWKPEIELDKTLNDTLDYWRGLV